MSMPVEVSFMPMKILVLGHFDGSNVENPQHLKVNKDSFQNIFSELNPRLYMRVANKLTSAPKELNIDLIFTGMDSFLPKAIADRIEVIKEAVKVRKALHDLAEKQITLNETKNAISDSAVVNSQIPDIVAIIEDHIKSEKEIEPQILDNAISKLDSALSDQFDEILHNPKFQQLESAWRGLKLLLENADFPDKVQFEILNVEKENLIERFDEKVFQNEYDDVCDVPLSAILADFDLTQSTGDLHILKKMAEKAAILQVAFISSLATDFLGMRSILHLVALPDLFSRLTGPAQTEWKSIMQSQQGRWISLTMNRFLLRDLYSQDQAEIFNYTEKADASHPERYLWGCPIWIMGIILARSFATTGLCLSISGVGLGGEFTGLPVREFPKSRTEKVNFSVETTMVDDKVWSFLRAGVTPLNGVDNSDMAYFPLSANAYRSGGITLHSTLAYHLYISHVFHRYFRLHQQIPGGSTPEQIVQFVRDKMYQLIAPYGGDNPEETVTVNVTPVEGINNTYVVSIYTKPKLQIESRDVEFTLQLQTQV